MAQLEQQAIQVIQVRAVIQAQTALLVTVVQVVLEEPVVMAAVEAEVLISASAALEELVVPWEAVRVMREK